MIDPQKVEYLNTYKFQERIDEIAAGYKKEDEGKVIFYGDSYFTRWQSTHRDGNMDLAVEMNAKNALNHGFGTSSVHDLCLNYDKLVKPWKPSALVIATFANDFNYKTEDRIALGEWLVSKASEDFPNIPIYMLNCRPLLKDRTPMLETLKTINKALYEMEKKYPNLHIIRMSEESGFYESPEYAGTYMHPNPALYLADQVHLTHEGYKVFSAMLRRELKDILVPLA